MSNDQNQQDDNGEGIFAALLRFYRDRPVAFALALIALSTLMIIVGIWMLPASPK